MGAGLAAAVPATAQVTAGGEAAAASSWELGVAASAIRIDESLALDAERDVTAGLGAHLAWRPVPLVALMAEAWRATVTAGPEERSLWAAGVHMRVTPWAEREWVLQPALHFGVERLSVDDDEDRSLAFVAGAGLSRLSARWTLDVAVRNHHLSVDEEPVARPEAGGDSVATARDSSLWEVRASLGLVLGGP